VHFTDSALAAVERALVEAGERLGTRLPGTRSGANT
jgi:hypothetical protein